MIMNKKGISAIVATVLIILITVAAVTIIWAAIIPMISNNLASGTICLDAVSQVKIEQKGYTCVTKPSCFTSATSGVEAVTACQVSSTYCALVANGCGGVGVAGVWGTAVKVQVSRGAGDFALKDVQIISYAAGSTVSLTDKKLVSKLSIIPAQTIPGVNEEKVIKLIAADFVAATDLSKIDTIEIAPIVSVGATDKTCDVSSTQKIAVCA